MTRDEIIGMAREAGGGLSCIAEPLEHPWKFSESELIRFAALIASLVAATAKVEEREACAQLVDNFSVDIDDEWVLGKAAKAIRARGNT